MTLTDSVLTGDRLALARLLTQVENDTPDGRQALNALFPYAGKAHRIGVTGAPGTGKSSLVNQLARYYRHPEDDTQPRRVAIVAIDPTSPFSGGAILGDRVRMRDLSGDPGVFIRSMASRGSLGGLAVTTTALVQVFDAAGYEIIFIETVGAGQAEVDIARLAHTTLVVEAPGLGDDIQAIKAGILEIADVLVVNKADLPGAEVTELSLRSMLELAQPSGDGPIWSTPVLSTVAPEGAGISELAEAISGHREFLLRSDGWHSRDRFLLQTELDMLLHATLVSRWRESVAEEVYRKIISDLVDRKISPYQAVERLLP